MPRAAHTRPLNPATAITKPYIAASASPTSFLATRKAAYTTQKADCQIWRKNLTEDIQPRFQITAPPAFAGEEPPSGATGPSCAAAWPTSQPTLPKVTGLPNPRPQRTNTSRISSKIPVRRLPPERFWGIIYSGIGLVTAFRRIVAFSLADRHAADARVRVGFSVHYPARRTGWMQPDHHLCVFLKGTQTGKKTATSVGGGGLDGVLTPLTARLRGTT